MAKVTHGDVLDAALAKVATCIRMSLCSSAPADFAGIAAVSLGSVALTAGDGNGDYTISAGDVSGRKVRVAAQSGMNIDATGTVTHLALDDGATLLLVTEVTSQPLTEGNTANAPAFDYEIPEPT